MCCVTSSFILAAELYISIYLCSRARILILSIVHPEGRTIWIMACMIFILSRIPNSYESRNSDTQEKGKNNINSNDIAICTVKSVFVYFDQGLGAVHSKHWSNYAFSTLFAVCTIIPGSAYLLPNFAFDVINTGN